MLRKPLNANKLYLLFVPLACAVIVLSLNLNKPFIGHHDFMGAMEGLIAKNYLKFGVWDLKLGQIIGNPVDLQNVYYFIHYPPLLPLLITLSFALFGVAEWSERLVPALFSVGGVAFFFLIVQKLSGSKTALMASLFFTLNPMFIYFGSLPAPEPVILSLALAAFYFYLRWLESQSNFDFLLLCLSLFTGGLVGWPIGYIGPLLIFHSLITKRFRWRLVVPTLVLLSTLVLQLLHGYILNGGAMIKDLKEVIDFRLTSSALSFGGQDFNLPSYIRQEISWLQIYFTRILIIFSALYAAANLSLKFNREKAAVLFFLIFGLAHPLIFSRYVFIHDFLNIYLLPFFALAGALGLRVITENSRLKSFHRYLPLVVTVAALVMFTAERRDYTRALLETRMNTPGLEMSKLLNELQDQPNEAVIISPRFASFYGIFTQFYSRHAFGVIDETGLTKGKADGYKYIITIDEDVADKEYFANLARKYRTEKRGDVTVIYTDEKI